MASCNTNIELTSLHCGLSVCSYNCHGFNFVKKEYINKLLLKCDVLFVQELWLSEAQLVELGYINNKFLHHGVCGFDNNEILNGRPYGGCAIVWRADNAAQVETVVSGSMCH
jgi:hypothetical protein